MLRANVKRVGRLESEAGRSLNWASRSNAVRRLSSAVWSQARLLCGGCAMQSTAGNRSTARRLCRMATIGAGDVFGWAT